MAKIYKTTDRIPLKLGDEVIVKLAPLSLHQKAEVTQMMLDAQKENDIIKINQSVLKAVSYSLKCIEGVKDSNNEEYKLKFDEQGNITPECLDELSNMTENDKLTKACSLLINGVPSDFKIEGVTVIDEKK